MVINALNSGAKVFMADFEDATSPVWDELVQGQVNLRNCWLGRLDYTDPDSGKHYAVGDNPAVLMVRPRGWHLARGPRDRRRRGRRRRLVRFRALPLAQRPRRRCAAARAPISTCPSSRAATRPSCGATSSPSPSSKLRLERGTIKATVLIETLPAAFEMDEILYALRENIVGLNCGRWDYIFSYIKRLGRIARPADSRPLR